MRPRRDPRSSFPLTLATLNASLDLAAWEAHWGGEREGREAWAALRARFPRNATTRPAPFWAYTPDVPEELRGDGSIEAETDRALGAKRLRWLLGPGKAHQRPDEAAALYDAIGALEG